MHAAIRPVRGLSVGLLAVLIVVLLPAEAMHAEVPPPATRSASIADVEQRLTPVDTERQGQAGPGAAPTTVQPAALAWGTAGVKQPRLPHGRTRPAYGGQRYGSHVGHGHVGHGHASLALSPHGHEGHDHDHLPDAGWHASDPIEAPIPFVTFGIAGSGEVPHLRVRTRDRDGFWSDWVEAEIAADHRPGPHTPEAGEVPPDAPEWGTDAIWSGPATHVEIEVAGVDPSDIDLEVTFIDTSGLDETVTQRIGRWLRSFETGTPAEASHTTPDIRTRAQWGADESLRSGTPVERDVKMGVVHHTAGTNTYTREQADAVVRGIYEFHTNTRGWSDIGYNFLVDRYGTTYEGRYGGIDRGIQGAHAYGWNAGSFGVAVMGDHRDKDPAEVSLDALTELFAWKYAVHGIDSDAKAQVTHNDQTVPTLQGHRDVGSTTCPGARLYDKLPELRERIEQAAPKHPVRAFPDVPHEHPFAIEIGWASGRDVLDGYEDGTFKPRRTVTRQAAVAFLHRYAGEPQAPGDPGFSDVDGDHPFRDAIAWASHAGITDGYEDGTFRPGSTVTRQAATAFLHRYAGEPQAAGDPGFSDVDGDHPFRDVIAWASHAGITDGYEDGTFRPGSTVTRQAATAFLHRLDSGPDS